MKLEPGRIIAGRYAVKERIGIGGMAVVYRAMDRKLDRSVALKVMREEFVTDHEFAYRFEVEARAAASLSDTHIVNVYDVGQDDAVHFIVMEFIDGLTLKELIIKKAPFTNEEILGVGVQIAAGVAHAHQTGVIHRDIKPQNIMVTRQGVVKVMDFGIARAVSAETVTTSANTMGSVHYFSPEQARGVYVDQKSDIYSLGIVLFEMATGRLPFDGDTAVAVALKQIEEPLPGIRAFNPAISPHVEKIIEKAASKSTTQRYQSAEELIADIKWVLKQQTGSFMEKNGITDSPTIKISPEEMAEIQKENKRDERHKSEWEDEDLKENSDDKTAEHKTVIAGLITSLVIILLLSSLGWYLYQSSRPKSTPAPNVAHMTLTEAKTLADEAGTYTVMAEERWSDDVSAGVIISQNIPEGEPIQPGEALQVIVSKGSNKIVVPDVRNMEEKNLDAIFSPLNLAYSTEHEFNDNIAQDLVIRQIPEANSRVDPDTSVTVYVSRGVQPRIISVPNVVGKTEAEAITILEEAGLVVGPSSKTAHSTVKEGLVIAQTLKAGAQINKGAEISFVVSEGEAGAEPTRTETPLVELSKRLVIEAPSLTEEMESVHLRVLKIVEGSGEYVLDKEIPMDSFPYTLTVRGRGVVDFQVYLMNGEEDGPGQLLITETIDFEEE